MPTRGKWSLSDILTSSGKRMTDLSTLPQYCSAKGDSFICWNSMLGTCLQGRRCQYARGHVKQGDAMDAFADATLDCVSKGVLYYTNLPPRVFGLAPQQTQVGRGRCRHALTPVGAGCSRMRIGGQAHSGRIQNHWQPT